MLLNLHKRSWMDALCLEEYSKHCGKNEESMKQMLKLAKNYKKVRGFLMSWSSGSLAHCATVDNFPLESPGESD